MAKLRDMLKLMDVKQDFYIVLGNDEEYYSSRYDFLARDKSDELLDKEFIIATSIVDGAYRIELVDSGNVRTVFESGNTHANMGGIQEE